MSPFYFSSSIISETCKIQSAFGHVLIAEKYHRANIVQHRFGSTLHWMSSDSSLSLLNERVSLSKVTRNNIVWKLVRGYCLCYCKTFSLVPDSIECTKIFLPKCAVHYLYHLKSNNIISQRKTTNTEKHFYPWLISFNLKLSCT